MDEVEEFENENFRKEKGKRKVDESSSRTVKLYAHRSVLVARSVYFRRMFFSGMKEVRPNHALRTTSRQKGRKVGLFFPYLDIITLLRIKCVVCKLLSCHMFFS